MLPVEEAIIECFFIDRDYYIQAVCDPDESVVAFSVTTRSKRFAPTFLFPPMRGFLARRRFKKKSGQAFEHYFKVKLGHTRFADLPSGSSPKRKAESGARTYSYPRPTGMATPATISTIASPPAAPRTRLGSARLAMSLRRSGEIGSEALARSRLSPIPSRPSIASAVRPRSPLTRSSAPTLILRPTQPALGHTRRRCEDAAVGKACRGPKRRRQLRC